MKARSLKARSPAQVRRSSGRKRQEWAPLPHQRSAAPRRSTLTIGESTQTQVRGAFQKRFEDGEIIFDEGDEGTELFVIQSGEVRISRSDPGGARMVAKLVPGDFFGEMSVVLGEARTARASALGSATLLVLDGETLESMCIERPEIGIRMIQRLAVRLIGAERRLAAVGLDDLVGPVVRFLGGEAEGDLESEFRYKTTLRELAEQCQTSLSETHQALHQLMEQKLLRIVGDELIAPDRGALREARARFEQAS